jgi:hypothetical protein
MNRRMHKSTMNLSRGAIHFKRLFSLRQIGVGNCEPFTDRIIRKFLEIGEGVAARWIEMPQGVLLLQMVPGQPDSGAIYLYDREKQVFYMVGFDGPEDNLTVEEFNQLLKEYKLVQYAEQPSLIHSLASSPSSLRNHDAEQLRSSLRVQADQPEIQRLISLAANLFVSVPAASPSLVQGTTGPRQCRTVYRAKPVHVWFQRVGSA